MFHCYGSCNIYTLSAHPSARLAPNPPNAAGRRASDSQCTKKGHPVLGQNIPDKFLYSYIYHFTPLMIKVNSININYYQVTFVFFLILWHEVLLSIGKCNLVNVILHLVSCIEYITYVKYHITLGH